MTEDNYKTNKYGFLRDLKSLMLGSGRGLLYFLLAVMLVLLNLYFVPGVFFNNSDGWFDEAGIFSIGFVLIDIGCLLGILIYTPRCMRSKVVEEGGERSVSPLLRMFSLWLPFFGCIAFETLVGVVCSFIVGSKSWHFYEVLALGLFTAVLLFFWVVVCVVLYYASGLVRWYVIGLLTLNFAPAIIADGYSAISAACLMRAGQTINFLRYNVFINQFAFFGRISRILMVAAVIAAAVVGIPLFRRKMKNREAFFAKVSSVYRVAVTVVFSVALSLFLTKGLIGTEWGLSATFVINYLLWSIVPAGLISWFGFKKDSRIKYMIIILIIVVIIGLIIVGVLPLVLKARMMPPSEDKIESCTISISQVGDIGGKSECAELHGELLELFRQGYYPDRYGSGYKNPECVADHWGSISFSYKLKNGKTEYYSYKNLNDRVFDEYFISLMKSDEYEESLIKSTTGGG